MAAVKHSKSKDEIKVLLLEGIHQNAVKELNARGYHNVELLPGALADDELKAKIADVYMVGIRSQTQLRAPILEAAKRLFCVGCFSIGTNQVDLKAARAHGIPVFNAPYSNTRSVAELVIGEIVMLMRGIFPKSQGAHVGAWNKSAANSFELRGKTLGIVGYGHIGTQVSILAEAMGMQVVYYDIIKKLALGNAKPCGTLDELLAISDVVTLHVPQTPSTRDMMGEAQFAKMKKGSYFLNAARGTVVQIDPLAAALKSGHILGAALDVFPVEPGSNKEKFVSPLQGLDNVILTPHIGGSTKEAQENIGSEVAQKLIDFSDNGSTIGAVNFPQAALPVHRSCTRFLHIHRNVPGVMRQINDVLSQRGLNIAAQYLQTDPELGYVVVDVDGEVDPSELRRELKAVDGAHKVRFLYPEN